MTDHTQLRLRYALLKGTERESRFVDEVENGLNCNCVCPCCGKDVVAKNKGKKNEHHFAHTKGADCAGARMTALHMLAQNILSEKKQVLLPPYNGTYYHKGPKLKTFDHVDLEETCKNEDSTRRPDCIGYNDGKSEKLWIEIYCRHKIDDVKKADIINRKQYCIEIDFSDLLNSNYSKEDVEHRLIEDCSHSEWICCPIYDKINEDSMAKVMQDEEDKRRRDEENRKKRIEEEKKREENRLRYQAELQERQKNIATSPTYRAKQEREFMTPNIPLYMKDGIIQAVRGKSIIPTNANYSAELAEEFSKPYQES